MKLMITGAGGFLGKRLVSYYEKKHEVLGVNHADLDFTDEQMVLDTVKKFSPDIIIHCGAISDVSTCEQNPELSASVNVDGTRYLAKACAQVSARFVYCSSDQVYFGEHEKVSLTPHTETESLSPRPIYGQHKLLAEQAALSEQLDSVILRLTWMYDTLTEQELEKGRRNLATILSNALQTNEPLTFSTADYRGVTDVRDVIRQMEHVWQLPAGIYNYGSSNHTNMCETARRVLDALGKSELLLPGNSGNLRNLTMDTSKAEQLGIHFPDTADGIIRFFSESQN